MKAGKGITVIGLAALALLAITFLIAREEPAGTEPDDTNNAEQAEGSTMPDEPREDLTVTVAPSVPAERHAIEAATSAGTLTAGSPALLVRVVTAEGGAPLSGVLVRAFESRSNGTEPGWRDEATTDRDGTATLHPPHAMPLWLSVRGTSDHGAAGETIEFPTPAPDTPITLAVPTTLDTHWYLRIVSRGEPVSGAEVRVLYVDDDGKAHDHAETISDDAGLARVVAWSWKTAQARVRAGQRGLSIVGSTPGHDTPASAQLVELWPACRLVAVVVDDAGSPQPGLTVRLAANASLVSPETSGPLRMPFWRFEAVTDSDGRAVIESLPAEVTLTYAIVLDALTLQEGAVTLAASETQEQRFVLSSDGAVVARVTDATGAPLADMEVWLVPNIHTEPYRVLFAEYDRSRDHLTVMTDAAGGARFEGVPMGQWHVGVADFSGERTSCAEPIILTPDAPRADVELVHLPARWVAGSIVDVDGEGVSGVNLSIYGGPERGGRQGKSDGTGAFRVGPLTAGSYQLYLYQAPARFVLPEPSGVQAGDEDLRIILEEGGKVRGTIRDRATGQLASECYLVAFAYESPRPNVGLSRSFSQDGEFELEGLPASAIAILARHDDGRVGYVRGLHADPERDVDGVVIDLQPGAPIRFRYGGPAKMGSVLLAMDGVTLGYYAIGRGVAEVVPCPPGTLDILTTADGQEPIRTTLEVAPGAGPEELVLGRSR